jgi:hypothetical protein
MNPYTKSWQRRIGRRQAYEAKAREREEIAEARRLVEQGVADDDGAYVAFVHPSLEGELRKLMKP